MVALAELKQIKDILSGLLTTPTTTPRGKPELHFAKAPVRIEQNDIEDETKANMDPLGVAHL
jgi:hypothetical protein